MAKKPERWFDQRWIKRLSALGGVVILLGIFVLVFNASHLINPISDFPGNPQPVEVGREAAETTDDHDNADMADHGASPAASEGRGPASVPSDAMEAVDEEEGVTIGEISGPSIGGNVNIGGIGGNVNNIGGSVNIDSNVGDVTASAINDSCTNNVIGSVGENPCDGGYAEWLNLKAKLKRLPEGHFKYNRVQEMWRDEPQTVIFKMSMLPDEEIVLPSAAAGPRTEGTTKITSKMSVELTGSAGLTVDPKGRVEKEISTLSPITWQWIVTPTSEGEDKLLTLTVYVHMTDQNRAYTLKTYEDRIVVRVSRWDKVKDFVSEVNPVWAFAAAVFGSLVGFFGWKKKGKKDDV